ncbi:hypothetical protein, partial [Faecalispora jeddahensis]|uniref:hypothetical protein n=1 Tax=Faecalispora jeddahensis TaxID=1414721 RepID=UPI0027B8A232
SLPPPWQGGALPDELHPQTNCESYYMTEFALSQYLFPNFLFLFSGPSIWPFYSFPCRNVV